MKGVPLIVASAISVGVGIAITRGLCAFLDALDRVDHDRRYLEELERARRARSRSMHPSNTVRVIRTRPFDFERDAR